MRVVLLTKLASEIKLQNVNAALPVLKEAVALSRSLNNDKLIAETLLDLADYHIVLAEYQPATERLAEARAQFATSQDLGGEVRCLGRLALVAEQQGQYAASLAHCLQGLAIPVTSNTRRFNTSLKIQAGNTFNKLGDYAHARNYFLDALQVAHRQDYPDRINLALGGLGDVCRSQRQWVAARVYYQQSLAVSQRLGNAPEALAMQLNLAEISERQGKLTEAFALGHPALRQSVATGRLLDIPRAEGLLARVFLRQGQTDSAIVYGHRSLTSSQRVRYIEGSRAANEVLALAYAKQKNFAQAYVASIGRKAFNDSLLSEATTRRTAALQLNYELGKQQAQIKVLTQQARLQNQQRELSRLRQQNQLIGLGGLGVLAAMVAGFFFWQYRQRHLSREKDLRARLAADLRDDVGTLLRQISLQSNLLQEGLADAAGQRLQISRLSDNSRYAVRQLNDVVWSLDTQNDNMGDLFIRMRDYGYEVLTPRRVALCFEVPDELPTFRLPARLRRNLYLIYKECLQNVLNHAHGATRTTVRVRLEGPQLLLDVIDNGQPASPATAKATLGRATHGLENVDVRAAAMGGAATTGPIISAEGKVTGFRVRIAAPLPSA
ncbi:hypothetical protein BEN47_02485 [Hymenobacter lapidarius]|uniref:Signal transduction histidine kinase subgroup 3 dimerisation and phosphoacceptor domain-containing protein n=1 Tax=Hymenobacter lapidarius TaxID=1908237 RepID=A0A1G1T2W1_9BACT|nr:tetratricopeptide repeat protein [Hymenobacter lapidarius]OGX85210.1 hypothetical protein BEN47_02485 [Hymenobacter lapidarius]